MLYGFPPRYRDFGGPVVEMEEELGDSTGLTDRGGYGACALTAEYVRKAAEDDIDPS